MSNTKSQKERDEHHLLKFNISGAGVLNVSSSDILKTDIAKKQIETLGKLKKKHILEDT
ncbi:MAG: hypothetical protein AB2594_19075 [Candidatus Thiodiazotropha sp.]